MFSETWFASQEEVFAFPGYNWYYMNRKDRRGGGVELLISNSMDSELIPEFSSITPFYESLVVRCGNSVFCMCYRPPSCNVHMFLASLDSVLEYVNERKYTVILRGDFNIDMSASSTTKLDLESLLNTHACQNFITSPTRLTLQSATILDLFITNLDHSLVKAGTLIHDISDHLPIFMFVSQFISTPKPLRSEFSYRVITPQTLQAFRDSLSGANWNDVFAAGDSNSAYDLFMKKLTELYFECFPVKTCQTCKTSRKPWINKECLKLIRKRDQLFKAFIVSKSPEALKEFKKYRNFVTKYLRDVKRQYFANQFTSTQRHTEKVWKVLKTVLSNASDTVTGVVDKGVQLQGRDLANAFNDFFVSVGDSTTSRCDLRYMTDRITPTIFLEPVSENEIVATFLSLSNSRTVDADNIQMKPVKFAIDILAPCLTFIFNMCLSTGVFPRNMQKAKVTAVYKKGSRNEMSNYRPVSVLPVFSKGFEKIILTRLISFTNRFNLINSAQYGFRRNKSTELALLAQKELILDNFERKNMVLGLFLDFSKAFDLINHKILLQKLDHYGIRGIAH